eukprot:1148598-Pelagomonas_calceolata.AAC.3
MPMAAGPCSSLSQDPPKCEKSAGLLPKLLPSEFGCTFAHSGTATPHSPPRHKHALSYQCPTAKRTHLFVMHLCQRSTQPPQGHTVQWRSDALILLMYSPSHNTTSPKRVLSSFMCLCQP